MLMDQRMRKPFSYTFTALDVVHQAALSPLNAGDCVPKLQIQVGIDPSCISCYAMQALEDVDAELELDALRNIESVQPIIEYLSQPPCHTSSSVLVCG